MPTILNEQRLIEKNALLYEEKLKSPLRRFMDKNFTPADYFHIKSGETVVDSGYEDVEEILGKNSSIRFQRIENLPMYGLESIQLQLQQEDQGLDTNYTGEAIIMEGTIRPLVNDYFRIRYLHDAYLFRVTAVEYDTISSYQCYKINFMLEYIDTEKLSNLESQTVGEFTCLLENIGTEEKCIIEKSDNELLGKIDAMYNELVQTYLTFYYNERYNCLLGDFGNGRRLYDPYQAEFIRKHGLFKKKKEIDGLILIDQFSDSKRKIKYQKTVYRWLETKKPEMLGTFPYHVFLGRLNPQTAFYRWLDNTIDVVDMPDIAGANPDDHYQLFPDEVVDVIRLNAPTESLYLRLIGNFYHRDLTLRDIPLNLVDDILLLDSANLEVFFLTPILLYIIKDTVTKHMERLADLDDVSVD